MRIFETEYEERQREIEQNPTFSDDIATLLKNLTILFGRKRKMSEEKKEEKKPKRAKLDDMTTEEVDEANKRKLNVLYTVLIFLVLILAAYYIFGIIGSGISLLWFFGSLFKGSSA